SFPLVRTTCERNTFPRKGKVNANSFNPTSRDHTMSDTTPRVALPLLAAAQAQKHVTHNEALIELDALIAARILDRDLNTPPSSPADGDTYLVKATGTGAWTGQDGKLAYAIDG